MLTNEIQKELKINKSRLDDDAINAPLLIQKYLDLYYTALRDLTKLQTEYDKVYFAKVIYYKKDSKFVPENAAELKALIEGDQEFIDIKTKKNELEVKTNYLKEIVQQFRDRNWSIKNCIDFVKFSSGMAL